MKMLNEHYEERFGGKVYKLSLHCGFTCPNRDGTLGTKGCIFCTGSHEFATRGQEEINLQLIRAWYKVRIKTKAEKFIAYFQAFTNTYAPVEQLRALYQAAINVDYIVGLAIGTRPDCLGPEVLDLLEEMNRIKPVYVELGLQTIHEESVEYIRRGYPNQVYFDAVKQLKARGINVVTHVILGLPGETEEMMVDTTQAVVDAGSDGIKFHLLHVLQGTDLALDYSLGKFRCMTLEEYAHALKECMAILPEDMVVHRITGDGPKKILIAPAWSANKKRVLNYLHRYLGI